MYQFKIRKAEDGGYLFLLGDIKLLVSAYTISNGKHLMLQPEKAVAYFDYESNIYGISNQLLNFNLAEDLFDAIYEQYLLLTNRPINAFDTNTLIKLNTFVILANEAVAV